VRRIGIGVWVCGFYCLHFVGVGVGSIDGA
jgi:hypothetical protein